MSSPSAESEYIERACEVMHDAYELAAVTQGWETQERSRKPWAAVPEANRETMRAAVRTLLDWVTNPPCPAVERFAGGARLTSLDPANKSGHYVDDGPCWCGDVHYYRDVRSSPEGSTDA